MPNRVVARMANFTPRANTMFSQTILRTFLDSLMHTGIFDGESSIMTISAASMAASEPRPPMAMPTSDIARDGASLIPSPTYTTVPEVLASMISFRAAVLSAGSSS